MVVHSYLSRVDKEQAGPEDGYPCDFWDGQLWMLLMYDDISSIGVFNMNLVPSFWRGISARPEAMGSHGIMWTFRLWFCSYLLVEKLWGRTEMSTICVLFVWASEKISRWCRHGGISYLNFGCGFSKLEDFYCAIEAAFGCMRLVDFIHLRNKIIEAWFRFPEICIVSTFH